MGVEDTREQLELVERILATSSRSLCAGGEFYVVWGVMSAGMSLLNQLVADGVLPARALWGMVVLIVIGVSFSAWRSNELRKQKDRMSLMQRDYLMMMYLTLGITFVAQIAGSNFFAGWGQAALWNVGASIVLFYLAIHGNRRALAGGIVVIGALAIANFTPSVAGYVLGGGMLLGYAGFGVAELLARE